MKKLLWTIALVCAMLLVCSCAGAATCDHVDVWVSYGDAGHGLECIYCGVVWRSADGHDYYCDLPTACRYCGEPIGPDDLVSHDPTFVPVDAANCQWYCSVCETRKIPGNHAAFCYEDTSTCRWCGTTGLYYDDEPRWFAGDVETIYIYHDAQYINLDENHLWQCTDCGLELTMEHNVPCTAPTECRECGTLEAPLPDELLQHDTECVDLGSQHAWECQDCGYQEDVGDHWAYCDQDHTVCEGCGATGLNIPEENLYHESRYVDQGATHLLECSICGYQEAPEEHWSMCDAPNVCAGCGKTGLSLTEDDISHQGGYSNLGGQHQYKCDICGYEEAPADHWGWCNATDVCVECGAAVQLENSNIYHDEVMNILGEKHQSVCRICGFATDPDYHSAVCAAPDVCYYCGAAVEELFSQDYSLHYLSDIQWNIWDDTHEKHCINCGYSWGVEEHWVVCTDPKICGGCGKEGMSIGESEWWHPSPVANLTSNAAGHSYDCLSCNRHVQDRKHSFVNGVCSTCGYEESAQPVVAPGDASGDGVVDIFDALAILQYSVGWGTETNMEASDVNDDGMVDIFDALLILQYSVGWDVELK